MGKVRRKVRRKVIRRVKRLMTKKSEVRRGINSFMLAHREYFDGKRVIDFGSGATMQYKGFFNYSEYIPIDKDIDGSDICKKMDVTGDCGICVAVLEHCIDPVSALKNIRDCIGTGYLLLGVSIKYVLHMLPDDYYRFTQEFWRVVESCGFEIVEKSEILGKGLDDQDSSMLIMLCKGKE
jgi:hypothetical protein